MYIQCDKVKITWHVVLKCLQLLELFQFFVGGSFVVVDDNGDDDGGGGDIVVVSGFLGPCVNFSDLSRRTKQNKTKQKTQILT